jgi:hypothetical protein
VVVEHRYDIGSSHIGLQKKRSGLLSGDMKGEVPKHSEDWLKVIARGHVEEG